MRILELGLVAFGPFTGRRLDLSDPERGFHLVYGSNEAGKSTALRALSGLLYGIPARTGDAHLHAMSELRVAGRLRGSDGTELEVLRRKGNKNTLLDPAGQPLEEARLRHLLGGVSEELFRAMFGLDHVSLREGAVALLEGRGAVGESLFEAASGGGIHQVLERLRREADELFTPQGRTRRINQALAQYQDAERRTVTGSRTGEAWRTQQDGIAAEVAERERLEGELRERRAEQARLERAERVIPNLGRRAELLARLAELGGEALLPEDARSRRESALQEIEAAERELARLGSEIKGLEARLAGIEVPASLVELGETVLDGLTSRLGSHSKAEKDLPRVRGQQYALSDEVADMQRRLGRDPSLEEAERTQVAVADQARIRRLALDKGPLDERLGSLKRALQGLEEKGEATREQLGALGQDEPAEVLERALRRARRLGDLGERRRAAVEVAERLDAETARELHALGLWSGPLEAVRGLPVPLVETVERMDAEWTRLAEASHRMEERHQAAQVKLAGLELALDELQRVGSVPSEADLEAARERRDRGFALVRRAWLGGEEAGALAASLDPARPLDQAYEAAVREADQLADRLRREATRVERLASLGAEREAVVREREDLERHRREVEAARRELLERWRELWRPAGIDPLPPAEMRAWLLRLGNLVRLVEAREQAGREARDLVGREQALRSELGAALGAGGSAARPETLEEPLEDLVERAALRVGELAERAHRRGALEGSLQETEEQLAERRRELEECQAKLSAWRSDWGGRVRALGLGEEATPEEATAVLDQLAELIQKLRELEKTRRRVESMERDARAFTGEVEALVRGHAPDLAEQDPEQAADRLIKRYHKARTDLAERAGLQARLEAERARAADLEGRLGRARERVGELLRLAQVEGINELVERERRSEERRELEQRLGETEERLREAGEGRSLEVLAEEVRGLDIDRVRARLGGLDREIEELDEKVKEAAHQVGQLQAGLTSFHDSGAAEAALEAEHWAARIRSEVLTWARLRLAAVLLEREIERYRERHQGPILKRASELFPRLTLGHYTGLVAEFGEGDEPRLRCLRDDGTRVTVEGLSDGTRDQLYLALRLATIERHFAHSEPLPLVLDDVLIHFDDDRARAALGVLGELGERHQVLFFTHHARLRELAREVASRSLVEHELAVG